MQKRIFLGLASLLAMVGSLMFTGAAAAAPAAPPVSVQVACNGTGYPSGYFLHEAFVGADTCTRCYEAGQYWRDRGRSTYCRYSNSFRAELYVSRV